MDSLLKSEEEDFGGFAVPEISMPNPEPTVVLEDIYDFVGFTEEMIPKRKNLNFTVTGDLFSNSKKLSIKVFLDCMVKIGATVTGFHSFLMNTPKSPLKVKTEDKEKVREVEAEKNDDSQPQVVSPKQSIECLPSTSKVPEVAVVEEESSDDNQEPIFSFGQILRTLGPRKRTLDRPVTAAAARTAIRRRRTSVRGL